MDVMEQVRFLVGTVVGEEQQDAIIVVEMVRSQFIAGIVISVALVVMEMGK
jgi:hypothetical protein